MNQTATAVRPTASNIHSGQTVQAGYIRNYDCTSPNDFLCFKVGDLTYSNLKLLKKAFGVSTMLDLEFEIERLGLGSITAEFYDIKGGFRWAAYLWKGYFRVGSSADRLVLRAA